MGDKLRLGIIGAGLIAHNSHVPAAIGSSDAQITAIVDTNAERAAQVAADYGISPRIATDVRDVVTEIDAAVICTPNDSHAPIAVECLSQGRHVLIDKPMATSVEESDRILEAAHASDAKVAIGYATRFRTGVAMMKETLETRRFGQVRAFVNRFGSSGGWSPISGYILDKKNAGGGVLVVSGTHFLDRMLYWFGYPTACSLLADGVGGPEANCRAFFSYSSPAAEFDGIAMYSKTAALPAGTVIDTEAGYLMLGEFDSSELIFRPHDQPGVQHVISRYTEPVFPAGVGSFELQMDDFIDACLNDRAPSVDGEQGLASMTLLEDLYANSRLWEYDWYAPAEVRDGE